MLQLHVYLHCLQHLMWRSELSTSNQNLIRSGVFWLVRCWIVLVFSFFLLFFLNLLHNGSISPTTTLKKAQTKCTAEMENTAPTASPVLLQCFLQHGCEQRLQPANGFFKWNMLGSGVSKPRGWMCPRPGRLRRERGPVGPRAWIPRIWELLSPLLPG